jgi:hypothetical protein
MHVRNLNILVTLQQRQHRLRNLLLDIRKPHFRLLLVVEDIEQRYERVLETCVQKLEWGVSSVADVHQLKLRPDGLVQIDY